jgi:hypothetical protein
MKPGNKFPPLVKIVWLDHSGSEAWHTAEEMKAIGTLGEVVSVGWLYEETKDRYVLAGGYATDGSAFTAIQTIGKGLVVSRRVIKYP